MKTQWIKLGAGIAAVIVVVGVGYFALTATLHKPASPKANPVPRPTITDRVNNNWAGYIKYGTSGTAKDMTQVSGEWNVPSITPAPPDIQFSSAWIGIGGYGNFSKELIQIGTDQDTGPGLGASGTFYHVFWECAPQPTHRIVEITPSPGDQIRAEITQVGENTWTLALADKTKGQNFQTTTNCVADQSTAEWILEDVIPPGGDQNHPATMPKFSQISFSDLRLNRSAPGLADMMRAIVKNGNQTVLAPGDMNDDGTQFSFKGTR